MRVFLDSSFMIYLKYAADDKISNFSLELLDGAIKLGTQLISNIIAIDEVIWILEHKYGVSRAEVFELTDKLGSLLDIVPLDRSDYDPMKAFMNSYNLKPSDALHVASMKRNNIQHIVSEDGDFDALPWIKRVWLDTGNRIA